MLNARELRIGNLVNPKVKEIILTDEIVSVDPSILMVILGEVDNKGIVFEPIQLTEEWLIKFGYVKFKSNEIYNEWFLILDGVLKYKIIETVNHLKNNSKFTMPNSDKPIIIQYLHQLQNLYFALTGEELTITEKMV
jgi:hypothetical protein